MQCKSDGQGRWFRSDGRYIIQDSIIGYLVFESKEYFCSGGLDYKSFRTLKEAKNERI